MASFGELIVGAVFGVVCVVVANVVGIARREVFSFFPDRGPDVGSGGPVSVGRDLADSPSVLA